MHEPSSSHKLHKSLATTIYKSPSAQRFSFFSNGCTLGMELTTNYPYMRWIPCQFHKIHDCNAVFIHLQRITIRLSKMVTTEDSAIPYHQTGPHHNEYLTSTNTHPIVKIQVYFVFSDGNIVVRLWIILPYSKRKLTVEPKLIHTYKSTWKELGSRLRTSKLSVSLIVELCRLCRLWSYNYPREARSSIYNNCCSAMNTISMVNKNLV